MKTFIATLIILSSIVVSGATRTQKARIMDTYKAQGDDLFFTLYWHPDSSQTFLKHISKREGWVGFDYDLWKKVTEDERLSLLEKIGGELDRMDKKNLESWWKRHDDWRLIHSQLTLIASYLNQDTDFVEFAFSDPTLRPGFQWIIDKRPPSFDPKHISDTIATGETVSIFPKLVEHLLETPEKQRLECFSRLLAKIAKTKSEATQVGTGQPATRPDAKSDDSEKPQPEAEGRSR